MGTKELMKAAEVRRRFESGEARTLRLAAGLTLTEAAGAAGIAVVTLWRYENGQRTPRPAQALACGRLLDRLERELSK